MQIAALWKGLMCCGFVGCGHQSKHDLIIKMLTCSMWKIQISCANGSVRIYVAREWRGASQALSDIRSWIIQHCFQPGFFSGKAHGAGVNANVVLEAEEVSKVEAALGGLGLGVDVICWKMVVWCVCFGKGRIWKVVVISRNDDSGVVDIYACRISWLLDHSKWWVGILFDPKKPCLMAKLVAAGITWLASVVQYICVECRFDMFCGTPLRYLMPKYEGSFSKFPCRCGVCNLWSSATQTKVVCLAGFRDDIWWELEVKKNNWKGAGSLWHPWPWFLNMFFDLVSCQCKVSFLCAHAQVLYSVMSSFCGVALADVPSTAIRPGELQTIETRTQEVWRTSRSARAPVGTSLFL